MRGWNGPHSTEAAAATRKWRQVVALLASGAPVENVAGASAEAADNVLEAARRDPALAHAVWLLTQIPLAARAPDFGEATWKLGLSVGAEASLLEVIAAFSDAVDRAISAASGRTDLGEMARLAAAESLTAAAAADLPSLFGESPGDVRLALGKLAAPDRFARLARDFFARLTQRHLDYYLSRTLSKMGEASLRRCIYRIRTRVAEAFEANAGLSLPDHALIENAPWKGYRLNPAVLILAAEAVAPRAKVTVRST